MYAALFQVGTRPRSPAHRLAAPIAANRRTRRGNHRPIRRASVCQGSTQLKFNGQGMALFLPGTAFTIIVGTLLDAEGRLSSRTALDELGCYGPNGRAKWAQLQRGATWVTMVRSDAERGWSINLYRSQRCPFCSMFWEQGPPLGRRPAKYSCGTSWFDTARGQRRENPPPSLLQRSPRPTLHQHEAGRRVTRMARIPAANRKPVCQQPRLMGH